MQVLKPETALIDFIWSILQQNRQRQSEAAYIRGH